MTEGVFNSDLNLFIWYKNGEYHRDDDLPAWEYMNGAKMWWQNGKIHREGDKPAIERASGTKEWLKNGKYHRDGDKPAIEWADGGKSWYQNEYHRVERADGTKLWFKNGKLHREPPVGGSEGVGNLPAVIKANGTVEYWIDGEHVWETRQKTPDMIGAECVITLEVIYNDTDCGFCPTCKKAMRYDALREWLKDNDTCPHCRSEWSNNIVYK